MGQDEGARSCQAEAIMTTYVVVFRVANEMRKALLIERIKAYGRWMTYFDGAWLIKTDHPVVSIQQNLVSAIAQTDSLLIVEARPENVGGYLVPQAWDWLKTPW